MIQNDAAAVDLNKYMADKEKREAAEREAREQAAMTAAIQHAQKWERAMNRTFKGIFTRRQRRAFLMSALKDAENSN